jgi:hypothetical protein
VGTRHARAQWSIAAEHPGVNANVLTDPDWLDAVSATVALNGVPSS